MEANIPKPTYNDQVEPLVKAYQQAVEEIQRLLDRTDLSTLTRIQLTETLREIAEILAELDKESAVWVSEHIPVAVRNGTVIAKIALEGKEAHKEMTFSRLNRSLIQAVVADTQADLLAVTQNVERKVRATLRQVAAEVMRHHVTQGVYGRKTMNRDLLRHLRKKLGDAVETGIIDRAGRRWKPAVYVDMLTRTKMTQAHIEATINESVTREAYYGEISRHDAVDACRNWEGRIVKLTVDASGDYPYIFDLPRREIFHPCCRHVITPVRDPTKRQAEERG